MPSVVARSTAQNDALLLELPELSTDVPHVSAGTPGPTFDTDWYYLTTYEPPDHARDASDAMRQAIDRALLTSNINRILFDTTVMFTKTFFTNILFTLGECRVSMPGTERLRQWHQVPAEMTAPAIGPMLPRRGNALASGVSKETLLKAKRAGAFFETVRGPRADEDDPDYGL